jgi:copper chaperone
MGATIEMMVEGMGCEGCVASVTKAVRSAAPAAEVHVDLGSGRVTIENADAAREALKSAIEKAGYDVAG